MTPFLSGDTRKMTKAEALLGGKTRFAVLEALADAKQPVTAYQIAMSKGLDPAATYRCLAELSELRIVASEAKERSNNQTLYKLSKGAGRAAAEFLRSLKQAQQKKTSKESIDLEKWISPEMQAERMAKIVRLDKLDTMTTSKFRNPDERRRRRQDVDELLSKRISGELSALIASSKIAFDELFEQKDSSTFVLKT